MGSRIMLRHFGEMDAASTRVMSSRFYLSWPKVLSKAYTVSTVESGWRNIHFLPFNQEGILSNCPVYRNLNEEQKDELAFLMPRLIRHCLSKHQGCANGDDIYSVMGHVIGRPNKGIDGVRALQTYDLNRSRAGFYTLDTMMAALHERALYREQLEEETVAKRRAKEIERELMKARKSTTAFKRVVNNKKAAECEWCCMPPKPSGAFARCATCTRIYCLETDCVEQCRVHFVKCLARSERIGADAIAAADQELNNA